MPPWPQRLIAVACVFSGALAARGAHADGRYRAPEYGYQYGEFEGPRTLAMGGAGRAFGWSTSAVALNPANLPVQRIYHFEALFGLDATAHRLQYGGAIVDSITSRLAMGVLASRSDLGNAADVYKRSSTDVRVGLAYPLGDKLSFGVGGHYLRATQDGTGPLGESAVSRASGDDSNLKSFTFDAGLSLALGDFVRLGAVGYNLTGVGSALAPLMVGGGLGAKLGDLTLEGNVVGVDASTWGSWKTRYMLGGEYLVGDHYPLRLGYVFDEGTKRHAISGGVGYVDRTFALDAGIRSDVSAPQDPWGKALVFSVGLRYFYETSAPDQSTQY